MKPLGKAETQTIGVLLAAFQRDLI